MAEASAAAGVIPASADELFLRPLGRLANPARQGLNVARRKEPVGNVRRNASAVPDISIEQSGRAAGSHAGGAAPGDASAGSPLSSEADLHRLMASEYAGLRLLLARRTRDPELANDLLGDAICLAWEKWRAGQLAQPQQIAGYVYQVALNLLRNWQRGVGNRSDRRADPSLIDTLPAEEPVEPFEDRLASQVLEIVRSMTPLRDRAVIVRFYLEEESRQSICEDLGLTAEQFARVLHRARRRLRVLAEAQGIKRTDMLSILMCL